MNKEISEELKVLLEKINIHDRLYHQDDQPIITDQEYDQLCLRYDELINKFPNLGFSKRTNIGFKPKEQFVKIKHKKPMLSLNNAFSFDDIEDFIKRVKKFLALKNINFEIMCEPKIDGLSISLSYEKGLLLSAVTRGDGETGELVTENVLTIKEIPKFIENAPEFIEIRGEIFMNKDDFLKLNENQKKNNEKIFSNPRNAAAGTIRQKNLQITTKRKLNFIAYTIGEVSNINFVKTQLELLDVFNKWNFITPKNIKIVKNINEIKTYFNFMLSNRDTLKYEIDGLVYKINSFDFQNRLGFMSRAPRWAIAHKLPSITAETIINKIDLQVGRTGAITPVARVKKTNVGGVFVSNITLHNEDEIKRKDIRLGDTVLIERAGDVIPHIKHVIKQKRKFGTKEFIISNICPSCNSITIKKENEAVRRCNNSIKCKSQIIERLIHFCSKNAFNIEGLGEKQIKIFFESNFLQNFSDIFLLKNYKDKIIKIERFGETSLNNLFASIEKSKSITFDKFIFALGIRQIGENTAKLIADHYKDFNNLKSTLIKTVEKNRMNYDNLINIDQIGESIAHDLIEFFKIDENINDLDKLINLISIIPYNSKTVDSVFTNKKVVITGTLETLSRDEIKSKLNLFGAKVVSQVSNNTDYLIAGSKPGSKLKKAKEGKVKIINENEFLKMIELQ